MSGEKDLDQLKREAAEKAKAAALAKRQAKEAGVAAPKPVDVAVKPTVNEEKPVEAAGDDTDLAKKKAAAVAKAKAAAAAKRKAMEGSAPAETQAEAPAEESPAPTAEVGGEDDLAKKKAAAVAKAKAAAAAKRKAMEGSAPAETQAEIPAEESPAPTAEAGGEDDLAKKKAAAVAKAKAAAAAKAKAKAASTDAEPAGGDDEKAKAIAAAKAKAKAAAAAKAKATGAAKGDEAEVASVPVKQSPNQPYLDKYVKVISDNLGSDVLADSYINKLSKDVPTLVIKRESYFKVAQFLKYNELLGFDYLSELHGTDFETHMEVYVHLYSYKNRQSVAIKVKLDRDEPTIESLQPVWAGADWPECEAFDLLGIKFTGHPNLHRIMLGEDWVGHPLRKDYEPYDVEV
jgi:NADH-quinone oxidoreductase subunit C